MREFASAIISSPKLEAKLRPPRMENLSDQDPGPPQRPQCPAREPIIEIATGTKIRVPSAKGMIDPDQRVRILHAFANHELQAIELFAWAIVAFPEAPAGFRRGLIQILADEQRHFRLYEGRLHALGASFGDFPINGYFWKHIQTVNSPIEFACTMGLTLENANLDFGQEHITASLEAKDEATARVLERVHQDEIRHVRFGWQWLNKLKPTNKAAWDSYCENVRFPLGPSRARGQDLCVQSRREAGFDQPFIEALLQVQAERTGGKLR